MTGPRPRTPSVLLVLVCLLAAGCDHYAAADAAAPSGGVPRLTPAPTSPAATGATTAGCGPVGIAPPAVVDPLRKADGTCVPAGDAVVYRCDPASDPVAVLDLEGQRTRYLGGAYAVPLAELPADAVRLGVSSAGRIYEVPTVPPTLVVEDEDGFARWLTLPEPAFVGRSPSAMVIGDSIADGASSTISELLPGWDLTMDAEIGRASYQGAAAAEALIPLPDVVVVELGVNDTSVDAFTANAERATDAVRDADLVVWVTAHGPEPVTDQVNDAIVATMGALPNGAVADWDRAVPPEALSSDGVHLLDGSGAVFAEFLTSTMEVWRQAAEGHGPDRCGGSIAAAV